MADGLTARFGPARPTGMPACPPSEDSAWKNVWSVYLIQTQRSKPPKSKMMPRASDFPREYDGACLQMRLSYSSAAHLFLFLVQWTDCHLAGALGFLRILIYKVHVDGTTTMSIHERKASVREFYAVIYPSLVQLQRGITDAEEKMQRAVCLERYRKREEKEHIRRSDVDAEREDECGICMELNRKIVLPNCNHAMCLKCYHDW
ncbi:E3 ubiquitin-protein ligase AIRP2-like isoform X5 [Syzygium oleosum]|nr:E3 ubiquitin-protein ligase AIRP2-like isoform X5 [Syzygium oleosum]